MSSFLWPNDDGWPYPDAGREPIVLDVDEMDEDAFALRATARILLDRLNPLERQVITAHYGLGGTPALSMKQLHTELGLPRAELKDALGSGLAKLRDELAGI